MTNSEVIPQQEEDDNVVQFKKKFNLLPGGKGSDPLNWLKDIPVGYLFKWRRKPHLQQAPKEAATMCQILFHSEKCTLLYEGTTQQLKFWVMTEDFSKVNECLEVTPLEAAIEQPEAVQEEQQEEKDISDGSGNRAD